MLAGVGGPAFFDVVSGIRCACPAGRHAYRRSFTRSRQWNLVLNAVEGHIDISHSRLLVRRVKRWLYINSGRRLRCRCHNLVDRNLRRTPFQNLGKCSLRDKIMPDVRLNQSLHSLLFPSGNCAEVAPQLPPQERHQTKSDAPSATLPGNSMICFSRMPAALFGFGCCKSSF